MYYNGITYADVQRPERFFPYITQYLDSTNTLIQFTYKGKLVNKDSSKAIFLARTNEPNPKDIVVKFVRSYNSKAHALLAYHSLAPNLLYDGSRSTETKLEPDLWMIVMDFVPGIDLDRYPTRLVPQCVE